MKVSRTEPVKSLDDAFSKLVNLDAIVTSTPKASSLVIYNIFDGKNAYNTWQFPGMQASSSGAANGTDPFAEYKRAQKPAMNVLRGDYQQAPIAATTAAVNNPFLAPQPATAASAGGADPFANDPFFS